MPRLEVRVDMTTNKKKRNLALTFVAIVIAAVALLGWGLAEPADAKPGYSCNPPAGHGDPGCHVTVTTKPPTTKPPAPPTTKPPAPPTTKRPAPATTTTVTAMPTTTMTAAAAASTVTLPGSTTMSEDSTSTVLESSTTLAPTTSVQESTTTTDLSQSVADIAASGIGGGGGGLPGGWIAVLIVLGILAGSGWTLTAVKWAGSRRGGGGAGTSGPLRFVLAERLGHWSYALFFMAAGVTGALMWIPSTAQSLGSAYFTVSRYHGYLGLAMLLVPLLIFLILDRRRLAENRRVLGEWSGNDWRWLRSGLTGGMFNGKKMPPQGRFNAGQKINSYVVAGLTLAFVVTGTMLLARGYLPLWLASGVLVCHKVLAVAGVTLIVGHVSMALFTRHGRGGLKAMVKGILPAHIAREAHSLWYAEWLKHNHEEYAELPADRETRHAGPVTPTST